MTTPSASVRLAAGSVDVECHPLHGCAIGAIRVAGRNLLWNAAGVAFDPLATELGPPGLASAGHFDREVLAGGWFPLFPTVGVPADGSGEWMHGEAPRLPWSVLHADARSLECALVTQVSRFALTRRITVAEDRVRVVTRAVNHGDAPRAVAVGEHPCFSRATFAGGRRDHVGIPEAPGRRALEEAPAAAGRSELATADGELRVEMTWDAVAMPRVIFWEHFAPGAEDLDADTFAIEPVSPAGGGVRSVDPGAAITWWAELRIAGAGRDGLDETAPPAAQAW